jgi:hypothetical protein
VVSLHDETASACPITGTHPVAVQPRWSNGDLMGLRCKQCGEYSIDSIGQLRLEQYSPARRERLSLVAAAVWSSGVAPLLNADGVDRLAEVPFVTTEEEPSGMPHQPSVAHVTEHFRLQRQGA